MSERVILVTGGNGGLGQAIARSFLSESADNVLNLGVSRNRERADRLAQEFPGRVHVVLLDVTRPDSWEAAVQGIVADHQRIDVLVNNAGCHADGLLATMPREDWERVRMTNLDGTFYGCQAVMPVMIGQRCGRIVNVASVSALFPPAGQANYAAAKAGLIALTQSLAKEVARLNITVNAVCPGFVETEALTSMSEEEQKSARLKVPMRRFGRPEEIASAVRFLACLEASYITGSVLKIDGGLV